ncbi:MAG TPA: DUF5996 family protein [Gaiellaceae bacterium]|nr:DUF5996 family protein [Gaiellaceae bacterium]
MSDALPALPLHEWRQTKDTLHLWVQIVGKVKLASTPPENHWWNVPLYVDVRGLTTRRMHQHDIAFSVDFDFIDHRLIVRTDRGRVEWFDLIDGLSVAEFDDRFHELLAHAGVDVAIREQPFGVPMITPFPDDQEHARYQAEYVERFWRALGWADEVFTEFRGWFCGKSSPVHLFWHSLDLAVTRFSGRRAPVVAGRDPVTDEAYSHELISFGFWAGDDSIGDAAFYSYTAPEPEGLRDQVLYPADAHWVEQGAGSLAVLAYDSVRASDDPEATLLGFLESGYQAGVRTAGWDEDGLNSSFCPSPQQLQQAYFR